ncbi:MAG: aminotransferase class I/II-fold pyridoxal phosphate-dependent enzyme [Gammaproteobacteria bacterium]|uniref:aminotransferase class I/II-fold pyridoxal phosphate-dependent enzyme n=1 Tax=Limnobacter sp. TaxID=2003368 RepID=UPI001D6BC3BA|nr:aminotransferase class I/II-fold pyridoxal phosphate-dependent enzyme [Limnobacter sp.]MBU0784232.1 aminotransferase class I/II-fold pyridoxal phosphate-dependent enzyme [Gammaproteobacteria bacterium]MBU0848389.1 aminotransferase class I/II-fold pyridoxal phosphate-dependent enzyme [Gammaproteobacteria bacterium]MBU1268208.1 aminotransferase class I/II-fold pyridoxal phosphate-dependent enzyme [Gammaproteobacteria bacterium]MBU1529240.1 aminotransferase class I/II-fold pyridoxal phosphate-d
MNTRIHGGTDEHGPVPFDFSSNANAVGPCPAVLNAVQQADALRYPDPSYTTLRTALARFHDVDESRIVVAGSASEFIQRLTTCLWRKGCNSYWVPQHAYGDYAHAAQVWDMELVDDVSRAGLVWLCNPSSPLGQAESTDLLKVVEDHPDVVAVLDCAYEPLCLDEQARATVQQRDHLWQLWSPNKALGMTGVRGAYAIAPMGESRAVCALNSLAPSWLIGTHGQAMLHAWTLPETQSWLAESRSVLAQWKRDLLDCLHQQGWETMPSIASFVCAKAPCEIDEVHLRSRGIKLRDATSFGLPGWWRLCAQGPQAMAALSSALEHHARQGQA